MEEVNCPCSLLTVNERAMSDKRVGFILPTNKQNKTKNKKTGVPVKQTDTWETTLAKPLKR